MPSDSVRTLDRPANLDAGLLLARIMLSALFLVSGYVKLMAVERTTGYFASLGMPMPDVMVWVAILVELGLPILLLLGIRARWVALALCLFTLITAATGHRFWGFDTATQFPQYIAQLTQFLKNLGIAGGFLLLALIGPGRLRGRPARLRSPGRLQPRSAAPTAAMKPSSLRRIHPAQHRDRLRRRVHPGDVPAGAAEGVALGAGAAAISPGRCSATRAGHRPGSARRACGTAPPSPPAAAAARPRCRPAAPAGRSAPGPRHG